MERYTKPRKYGVIVVLLLIIVGAYAVGLLSPIIDPLTRLTRQVAGPTYQAGVAVRSAAGSVFDTAAGEDTEELMALVDRLRLENSRLLSVEKENAELKSALSYVERSGDTIVPARVISASSDDADLSVVIDRGSEDGIRVGMPVIVSEGALIGKVADVSRRTASVLLLTDSKSAVAVSIQNSEDTIGVLEGERGLSMTIELIPQSEPLAVGDIVVTSGIEPGIRRGLVIGVIDRIERDTQQPFQSATVAPLHSSVNPVFVHVVMPAYDEGDIEAEEVL